MTAFSEPGVGVAPLRLLSPARLARLLRFATAQGVVQLLGFASGLLLVHVLAQTTYGHYTLAVSLLGLATVMLDLGLATAVLSHGGRLLGVGVGVGVGQRPRLPGLLADARDLQRRLAIAVGLLLLPLVAGMFLWQGIAPSIVAALVLLVLFSGWLSVRNAVAFSVLRLLGDAGTQQKIELAGNAAKLLLLALLTLVWIDATLALAAGLLATAAAGWLAWRRVRLHLGGPVAATGEQSAALAGSVRRQAPNSAYYCISGQLPVWLVGILGSAERVAEVGALGRLAMVFALVGAVFAGLVQPYFARRQSRRDLLQGFAVVNLAFLALTVLLTAAALLLPQALLWILGPRYAGLHAELVPMVLASSLGAWSAALYSAGAARNWIVPAALVIPVSLATLVASALFFDVATVAGSLQMSLAGAAAALAMTLAFVGGKFFTMAQRR